MFHDEGASTAVTGMEVSSRARMTAGKGSRTSPEKENPGDIRLVVLRKVKRGGKRGRRQTEDCVDNVVCFFEGTGKVVCERDVEVFELC
jgi:hypothetical protein